MPQKRACKAVSFSGCPTAQIIGVFLLGIRTSCSLLHSIGPFEAVLSRDWRWHVALLCAEECSAHLCGRELHSFANGMQNELMVRRSMMLNVAIERCKAPWFVISELFVRPCLATSGLHQHLPFVKVLFGCQDAFWKLMLVARVRELLLRELPHCRFFST
jgi:hypothetical protein